MIILLFRTVLIYLLTILATRLMGKKQLGELQPSELVSTIMISNLASIPIESPELPLITSVIPVFILVSSEILLSVCCLHSRKTARLTYGEPRVIIRDGVIDQKALLDLRYTTDDLLEALHSKDIFELSDIAFAMVETNGSLSVMKTFSADSPCNRDFNFSSPAAKHPSLQIISDGFLNKTNMQLCGIQSDWVLEQCRSENVEINDVFLFLCNDAREFSIIKKESRR